MSLSVQYTVVDSLTDKVVKIAMATDMTIHSMVVIV